MAKKQLKNSLCILILVILCCCKQNKDICYEDKCSKHIFPNFENVIKDSFFIIKDSTKLLDNNLCACKFDLVTWYFNAEKPNYFYSGYIYKHNNQIYHHSLYSQTDICLFDFSMAVGTEKEIHFSPQKKDIPKYIVIWEDTKYSLYLEKKVNDLIHKDTIYKFRYKSFFEELPNEIDLVFLVSPKYGIRGFYYNFWDSDFRYEKILKHKGDLYFNKEDSAKIEINKRYVFL